MKIAFVKYAGLASGGTEKYLQTIALLLKREGHEVYYYYTNVARLIGRDWQHPPNDINRKKILEEAGIKTVECYIDYKVCGQTPEVWHGTDFFEKFDESEYDIIVSGRQGQPEYPFSEIKNTKIIDTIHGTWASGTHQSNIKKCILISQEQRQKWLSNGGNDDKCVVIPSVVSVPESYPTDFREKNNIPSDAFVYGLHQRDDPSIFSPVSLECFSRLENKNTYMVILGGSSAHRDYVKNNNIDRVVFVDHSSSLDVIHSFLDAIDVYAHSRLDGEVCSAAIIEAMYHGKPVITCPGTSENGHMEQIENCGSWCSTDSEYVSEMTKLCEDTDYYSEKSSLTKSKYEKKYKCSVVEQQLLQVFNEVKNMDNYNVEILK